MKTFNQLKEERQGVTTAPKKDTDDEVKGMKPRSKGEEDFLNKHKKAKKDQKHPVATKAQFQGGVKGHGDEHKGKGQPFKEYAEFSEEISSGRAQHAFDNSYDKHKHATFMKKKHGVSTKYHGSDEVSYHGPKHKVRKAVVHHYGGDHHDAKDLHPHVFKESTDLNEGTDLYEKNGVMITRYSAGKGKTAFQISAGKYVADGTKGKSNYINGLDAKTLTNIGRGIDSVKSKLNEEVEELDEDYKKQQGKYHKEAIKHAERIVTILRKMDPGYDSKFSARQLQDTADTMENYLENQTRAKKMRSEAPIAVGEGVEDVLVEQGTYRKGDEVGGGHKLTKEEADALDSARKGLNPTNAKKFDREVMKSKQSFQNVLAFAKAA